MNNSIRHVGNHLIVKFPRESDHHNLAVLNDKIKMELVKKGVKNIIFDFGDVSFIDSSAVGLVISKSKTVESLGGKTGLCRAKGHVLKVLKTCAATGINRIYENIEEAVNDFNNIMNA